MKNILTCRKVTIDYTEDQLKALRLVEEFKNSESKYMLISGNAGSGKTSIIENISKYCRATVLAPTNAAVKRILELIEDVDVTTIHKTIYGCPDPETGEWVPRQIQINKTYIIDESSMIDSNMLKDIIELSIMYNNKIIFIGDSYQLPPVNLDPKLFEWEKSNFKFNSYFNENFKIHLNEVKRQEGEILKIANHIRNTNKPEILNFNNDIKIIENSESFDEELIKNKTEDNSILICFTNKKRVKYNNEIRQYKFHEDFNVINKKEKVISVSNNSKINGEIFEVKNPKVVDVWGDLSVNVGTKKFPVYKKYDFYYVVDEEIKESFLLVPYLDIPSLYSQQLYDTFKNDKRFFIKKNKKITWNNKINIVTYAYAITAHKSQGQEFDKVYIDASYLMEGEENLRERWLYTAITRAKKEVVILKTPFMKIINP